MAYHHLSYSPEIVDFGRMIPALAPADFRNGVLLRSTNWLGDIVMTLPATWQLRRLLPSGVPLHVLCRGSLAPVWQAAPWIDGIIAMQGSHLTSSECAAVRHHNFGLGVVMPNSFGSAWDLFRCRLPIRIGRAGNLRSWLLTCRLPAWRRGEGEGRWHQLSYYLELMRPFGTPQFTAECPPLRVAPDFAAGHHITKGGGWIALAPGAAFGPAKQWPLENYIAVARHCQNRGMRVVVIGAGREMPLGEAIVRAVPGTLDLTGRTSLPELMSILANVGQVVANDSGTMHLAAALGTPGTALFASTDPAATGPIGAPWQLIVANVPCRPCLQRSCPLSGGEHYRCMRELPASAVLDCLKEQFS